MMYYRDSNYFYAFLKYNIMVWMYGYILYIELNCITLYRVDCLSYMLIALLYHTILCLRYILMLDYTTIYYFILSDLLS